jgi:hypothetical protein
VDLELAYTPEKGALRFAFTTAQERKSSGTLFFSLPR